MPALKLDAALVHMNRADEKGNAQFLGPDPYFDDLFCAAAAEAFVSCERIVPTEELTKAAHPVTVRISRMLVTGVVEAPNGAHFTSCAPDYERDEAFQRAYAAGGGRPASGGRRSARGSWQATRAVTSVRSPLSRRGGRRDVGHRRRRL